MHFRFQFFDEIGIETKTQPESQACATDETADDLGAKSISWWRYLLPFHYFV